MAQIEPFCLLLVHGLHHLSPLATSRLQTLEGLGGCYLHPLKITLLSLHLVRSLLLVALQIQLLFSLPFHKLSTVFLSPTLQG